MGHFDIPFVNKNSEIRMDYERLQTLQQELSGRIYRDKQPRGGFLFRDGPSDIAHLEDGEWSPFPDGGFFGEREQYGWFKHTFTMPERYAGKCVVYDLSPEDRALQFIAFVDGEMKQGIDENHPNFLLSRCAVPGECFAVALNAYMDDFLYKGPMRLHACLKVFEPEVFELNSRFESLLMIAHLYGADDLERIDLLQAMNGAAARLDLSTGDEEAFLSSVREATVYLKEHAFGATSPVRVSAIGHTHIDTAYQWRLRQTRDKAGRSFATVIELMDRYPEYKFMSSQPQLYAFVKEDYPALYAKIRQRVAEGRWQPEGGMWVESDTSLPSGESLVRQFLFGKRFFREEFGVDNEILWLPDVFGYSASLPQIMRLSGIKYFMTTKISWSEYSRFPYDTFTWEGIDGSAVLSHFSPLTRNDTPDSETEFRTSYNGTTKPSALLQGWRRYSQKDLNREYLATFGFGDGGGGPSAEMLEYARRVKEGIPGCPDIEIELPTEFFERLDREVSGNRRLPKWRGELYLQFHRGTLSAQGTVKRANRKSEFLLHDAETLCEIAHARFGAAYPASVLHDCWKLVLLNQFHDIIPGSAIDPVYQDAAEQYEQVRRDGERLITDAEQAILAGLDIPSEAVAVFNTLGFARTDVALFDPLYDRDFHLVDEDGNGIPVQKTYDGRFAFLASDVPAKGVKIYRIVPGAARGSSGYEVSLEGAENRYYRLKFDRDLYIDSIVMKENGRHMFREGSSAGLLTAYEDRPHNYPAWELKLYYDEKSTDIREADSAEFLESGSVRTVLRVRRHFGDSAILQDYIFYPHTGRIDVCYDIDWREEKIVLKADYPVDVNTDRATFDIQFGNLERSTTNNTVWDIAKFEVCGHKYADLSDNGAGVAILSDCKYGWAVKDGHIRPTLLKCAHTAKRRQDQGRHVFAYAIYPHACTLAQSRTLEEAYDLNDPLRAVVTGPRTGTAGPFSFLSVSADNVIPETLKRAEDGDAAVIRLYEAWNKGTSCTVFLPAGAVSLCECDLLEEQERPLAIWDGKADLYFKPFEIKTLKIRF